MGIGSSKNHITRDTCRYDLCSDVLVGLRRFIKRYNASNAQCAKNNKQKEDDQSAEIINLKDTNRTTNRYLGVLYLFLSWLINLILAL
jgi:hypothetical protein